MACYAYKYEGIFSTIFIFGITAFVYFLAIPLELYLSGKTNVLVYNFIDLKMSGSDRISIAVLAIFSLVGFGSALFLTKFFPRLSSRETPPSKNIIDNVVSVEKIISIMMIVLCAILAVFYHDVILRCISGYVVSYTTRYNHPLFSFLIMLVAFGMSVLGVVNLKRRGVASFLKGLFLLLFVFFVGAIFRYKVLMLPSLCGLAFCFFSTKIIKRRYLVVLSLLIIPVTLFFMLSFSMLRDYIDNNDVSVSELIEKRYGLAFVNSDPAGPFVSIVHELNDDRKFEYGRSYMYMPLYVLPKIIYPNRPLNLAERFARRKIPNWKIGQGLAYSPLAEAYRNFGYFGSLIQYFLFGLFWFMTWFAVRRYFFENQNEMYTAFYRVVGFFIIIISFRIPFSCLPRVVLANILPFLLVLYLARITYIFINKHKSV